MLLDTHVAHLHLSDELVDRQSLGALERVDNLEPLSAANFRNQTLVHKLKTWLLRKTKVADFTRRDL
jgi:hypothetical protein